MYILLRFIPIGLISLILFSCTSLPVPDKMKNALVVGHIVEFGKNYSGNGGINLNGENFSTITVDFRNSDSDAVVKVISDYGYFASVELPPGKYRIVNFNVKVSSGNGWMSAGFKTSSKEFIISPYSVTNLGHIKIELDTKLWCDYQQIEDFDDTKIHYSKILEKTDWATFPWSSVKLKI